MNRDRSYHRKQRMRAIHRKETIELIIRSSFASNRATTAIMGNFLGYLLLNRELHINNDTPTGEKLCRSLLAYYTNGKKPEEIQNILLEYRKEIYAHDTPMEISSASLEEKSTSLHGNTVPPDGCPRGRFTAPAGCAAESRMTILRSGISGRPWMPSSSCWKPSNFSHEKTLPNRGWQTPAAPGQEAFLTPYLTTVRTGTRGNSGFKSVKKYLIPSGKCWKALQIATKNLIQAFGCKMPGVRVSPLGPCGVSL